MFRGNVRLTGRATLPGELREAPAVAWQYKIEGGEAWAVIDPAAGQAAPAATVARGDLAPDYFQSAEGRKWGLGPALVDLYGDGRMVGDPGRAAKLLGDVPGLQTVEFQPAPGAPGIDPKQAVCFAYDGGKRREVWRSEVHDTIQNTNFVIADVDNDGKLEVVLAPHYRVIVYDGQTGQTKHLLKLHNYRNYGFFCCADVTGDKLLDFVVIADFAMHVDVVKNEGDHLRLLWRRDIEHSIQNKQMVLRPGPNPVCDINGDGRIEIIVNLFNERSDGRWHVVAYDAATGDTVFDLPGSYLNGLADVNGDGVPELFVAGTESLLVPWSAELRLMRVIGREPVPLWQRPLGQWLTGPAALPLTHSTIVANGTDDIVTARLPGTRSRCFFTLDSQRTRPDRLTAYAIDGSGMVNEYWSVSLPERSRALLRAVRDIDGDGADEVLVSFRQPGCATAEVGPATGATPRVVSLKTNTVPVGSIGAGETRPVVCARPAPAQPPLIVFEGADNDIIALSPKSPAGASPAVQWRTPGAGPAVLADLNGDGSPEVLIADWSPSGEGELVALTAAGDTLWRHPVRGFPGPHPSWNFPGITTWWVGRYTANDHYDVWITARRGTMHSDEAWLLRGTDGQPLWHLREVRTNRTPANERGWGAGGSSVCSADVDGDGLEDVISLYPVNYMAAQGTSGRLLHSIESASGLFEGVWGAYCLPMVCDFNSDGKEELLWCGPYHHGLTTLDGRVLWYHKGGAGVAGVGDVDGDGKLELGFTGWEKGRGLRCLDAATGSLRWEWPLENNPRISVYTADIDGDGCDEFLLAVANVLYAVNGKSDRPNLVWQVELPSTPGDLCFADTDGDGATEILFIGADSKLYCLDRWSR